jgi:hypothetical protein
MGAGGERADRNNSLPRRVSGAPSSIDGFIWAGNQRMREEGAQWEPSDARDSLDPRTGMSGTSGIKGVFASRG